MTFTDWQVEFYRWLLEFHGYLLAEQPDLARELPLPVAVSEVPEPSTWGLLLVGVGLVAYVARRHGRKNRQDIYNTRRMP